MFEKALKKKGLMQWNGWKKIITMWLGRREKTLMKLFANFRKS